MKSMFIQVVEELYDRYISWLSNNGYEWEKKMEFTPVGRWCLVEVKADSYKELDKAEQVYVNM